MAALAYLSVFVILIYLSFLPLSAKDSTELKQYFLFASPVLLIVGVIGHIDEKTSVESSFILGLFIFMLLIICVTAIINALELNQPDYLAGIVAYGFFIYALASAFVSFLVWAEIIVEAVKFTGG